MKIYETTAFSAAGRHGRTQLSDGSLEFDLSVPGSARDNPNPEQLFALGYAACFDNAVKVVAQYQKVPLISSETHATVALIRENKLYRLQVLIGLRTTGLTNAQAQTLLEKAHQVCPYSNALRGNAEVEIGLLS